MTRASKLRVPFQAAYRNILIHGQHAAALYRLETVSFAFLSTAQQEQELARLMWWAYGVEADFSLYRVSRAYPADEYVLDTVGLADPRTAPPDLWEATLERHAKHLTAMRSHVTEVYVAITLRDSTRKPWQRAGRHDGQALGDAEQHAYDSLAAHLPCSRATTLETQWLVARAGTRGITEPELDPNWTPPAMTVNPSTAHEPRGVNVTRLAATITERDRTLIVDTEDGTSHQAMLTLGALPRTMRFPGGAELLFTPLESLPFPVDVAMHCTWVDNRTMQTRLTNKVRDADNMLEEHGPNPLSWAPAERRVAARDAHEYFATEPYPPGLDASISFAVGASSVAELKSRVVQLRRKYGSVKLYQPTGLQRDLYDDLMPHPGPAIVGDYTDTLTIIQFGALMPVGTHAAGTARGPYIGHTEPGAPRPVRFDLAEASKQNRSPAILLVGALGRGKTIAAQSLINLAAQAGSLIVDIDPKPDHNLERLPGLERLVHVIELDGSDRNRGLLDPLVVTPEIMREEMAAAYFTEILPDAQPTWKTQILRAVKQAMKDGDATSMRVLDMLVNGDNQAARDVGAELEVWADTGLGRLAFGERTLSDRPEQPITTIRTPGLVLPPPGVPRSSYQQDELLGAATHKLLVGLAMRLVQGDRSVHKIINLDEAHTFLGSTTGRRFLDRINRMGRSMNVTLILSTQLIGEVGDLESLIGTRIIFGQETEQEAQAVLPIVGLDPSDGDLVKKLRGFTAGQCFFRGIDDRVAQMRFDVVDPRILEALNTNPAALLEVQSLTREKATR